MLGTNLPDELWTALEYYMTMKQQVSISHVVRELLVERLEQEGFKFSPGVIVRQGRKTKFIQSVGNE
jgi:hypothetical protein